MSENTNDPLFRLEVCPKCGSSLKASFNPNDTVVHIHDDGGLTEDEFNAVQEEIAAMVDITPPPTFTTSSVAMAGMPDGYSKNVGPTEPGLQGPGDNQPVRANDDGSTSAAPVRPFIVSRGNMQFIVPAAIMEKAMHHVPALRQLCENATRAGADPEGSPVVDLEPPSVDKR